MTGPSDAARERFFGLLTMAGGAVIAALCGLCTLTVGGLIGGLPTALGVTLFVIGLRQYRAARAR